MYKTELDWVSAYKKLEQENEELKKACDETQELLDKQIEATLKLDKENTELKSEKGCETCTKFDEAKLTEAKGIIRALLFCLSNDTFAVIYEASIEKAKQFLSEVKK